MDKVPFDVELAFELGKLSLVPDAEQIRQFSAYYELLHKWSLKINLTTITRQGEVIRKHFADSLSPMAYLSDWEDMADGAALIDVGTGAGFPGLPLKIMNPGMQVTLLDSLKKRIRFLDEVIESLSLSDTATLLGRAEDMGSNEVFREKYDICVSRAVASLSTLSEYCLPFVRLGGRFIAYKSANVKEETEGAAGAIDLLGGEIREIAEFNTADGGRSLIVIEKTRPTPKKYPRRAGVPEKRPL